MAFKQFILSLGCLCILTPPYGSASLASEFQVVTDIPDFSGNPAVYLGTSFELGLQVMLPDLSPFDLEIELMLPGGSSAGNCRTTIFNDNFDCSAGSSYSDVEFNIDNVTISLGANVVYNLSDFDVHLSNENEIYIYGSGVVLNIPGTASESYINISLWNTFPDTHFVRENFYSSHVSLTEVSANVTETESNVTVNCVGPALVVRDVSSVSSTGRKSSGAVVTHYGTVKHKESFSTQNATNVTISVFYDHNSEAPITSIQYDMGDGLVSAVVANPFYLTVPALTIGDRVDFVYLTALNDDVELNGYLSFYVDLTFSNEDGHDFKSQRYMSSQTAPLIFGGSGSGLPDSWPRGSTVDGTYSFTMDYGTIPSVEINIDGYFEDVYDKPIGTSGVVFRTSESDIVFSGSTSRLSSTEVTGNLLNNDQYIFRKKRALTGDFSYGMGFGNIVNPASSGNPNAKLSIDLKSTTDAMFSMATYPALVLLLLMGGKNPDRSIISPISMLLNNIASGGTVVMTVALLIGGQTLYLDHVNGAITEPDLFVNHSVQMDGDFLRFNVSVDHSNWSDAEAYDVQLSTGSEKFDVYWGQDSVGPPTDYPGLERPTDRTIKWTEPIVETNESMFLSYKSKPVDEDLDVGPNYVTARLQYAIGPSMGDPIVTDVASVCIERVDVIDESVIYQYGLSALGLIVGLIVGALLVFLILFIVYKVRRENPFAPIRPASAIDDARMREGTEGLLLSSKDAMARGVKSIKDFSKRAADESIVFMLAMKDKLARMRALDNMDILTTINVDENIETERNKAMMDATKMLVASLVANGDINKGVADKTTTEFQKNLANLEKNQDNEYKKEMEKMFKRLSMKNKEKLTALLEKQADDREAHNEKTRGLKPEEKKELDDLLKEQHETEKTDLAFRLKLEQDEETEKLRKEFSVRKRIGIKGLQNDYLDNVRKNGQLSDQQHEWLMKEHYKNQAGIEKLYDDEISRQRMVLEEKLARRRALGEKSELQDENHSELLNTMAGQQISMLQKAKKDGTLSKQEARGMIEKVHQEMVDIKSKYDSERTRQEEALHKKLSERKKQKMDAMGKQHQQELNENDKKMSSKASQGVDPLSALGTRQAMISNQRNELAELENEIDKENSEELMELRDTLLEQVTKEVEIKKTATVDDLTKQGLSKSMLDKILKNHEKELDELKSQQDEDKQKQDKHLKKRLAQRREEMSARKQEEKDEQENLREHEEKVVRKLLDNQVAMSEEERTKVMQEHEKQLVKLENSLTLNKLSQRRMLEDKLAKKRARQMEKLEKKQASEEMKQARDLDSEDSDAEFEKQMGMMKKHAEQKMAILQGETLKLDDEMDQIREEMMKERAAAMKEQEVKLGAMLAELQMAKAKEMAKIEEQQKAINNLKTNLMDDLNEKGVLSDPECQRVIEIHQKEQEKLNSKIESQRAKQEKAMRRRLEERLKQKETQMTRIQEQELDETLGRSSRPADKIRRAALMHKHMIQMEEFRNKMDREMNQTLEEMKRQNEMRRLELMQDQELQFINGLVRLGKFRKDELENVVAMLFPTKKEAERKELLGTLLEGYKEPPQSETDSLAASNGRGGLQRRQSTLEQRIQLTTQSGIETESLSGSMRGSKKKLGKKGKRGLPPLRGADDDYDDRLGSRQFQEQDYYDSYKRPEPVGRSNSPDQYERDFSRAPPSRYEDDYPRDDYSRAPPGRLPPMEPIGKKKKKKKTVGYADEDYVYSNKGYGSDGY